MRFQSLTTNRYVKLLKETVDGWLEDGALRLSAAVVYYSIFSIAPLLIITISIAGLVFGADAVRGQLDDQLKRYIGTQAAEAVQSMVQSASKPAQSWAGALTGFFVLMLGASGVFGQLKDALNTIWEVKPKGGLGLTGFIRERLLSFGMVLVIGFLLLTSLLLSTAIAAASSYMEHILRLPAIFWNAMSTLISFGSVTLLFALIFKMLPDAKVEWRNVWIGAVVTAALFEIGKFGLAFYLGRESTASSYGAAAAVVLLLLWVYYTSCILFFGAEFTQVYARATGHVIEPAPNAEPVSAEARAQQGLSPKMAEVPSAKTQTQAIVPAREPAGLEPWGALLVVTALSFLAGIAARRHGAANEKPVAPIRKGVAGLSGQAAEKIAKMFQHGRPQLERRTV